MALVLSKHIELKGNISIQKFMHEAKNITKDRLKNKITGEEYRLNTKIPPKMIEIIQKITTLT
jgi:hypothetical protein